MIGAGLAGLIAAHKLQNQGYEVVVVEARDRIGVGFGLVLNGRTCLWIWEPPGYTALQGTP